MKIKQIRYNLLIKYLNPTIGLMVLLIIIGLHYIFSPNISMWDYEGFSMLNIVVILIGIIILLYGLYNLSRNDDIKFEEEGMRIRGDKIYVRYEDINHISTSKYENQFHTKKGNFSIRKAFVKNNWEIDKMLFEELKLKRNEQGLSIDYFYLFALLISSVLMFLSVLMDMPKNNKWQEKILERLPLKKIETIQIEGTIAKKATVKLFESPKGEISSVSLHGGLEEYPEIYFHYDSFTLDEQVENIKNPNPEDTKNFNEKFNMNYKKLQRLPEGTKVKIKVRTKDYEDLKNYMAIRENPKKSNEKNDYRGGIQFYELSLDEEIIVQKKGLK